VARPNDFHGAGSKSAEICPSGDLLDELWVPAVMRQLSPSHGPAVEQGAVLILPELGACPGEQCLSSLRRVRAQGRVTAELGACSGLRGCCFRGMDLVRRIRALQGPKTGPGGHSQAATGTHLVLRNQILKNQIFWGKKIPKLKPLKDSLALRILGKEVAGSNTTIFP